MKHKQFDYTLYKEQLTPLLQKIEESLPLSNDEFSTIVKKHPKPEGGTFSKTQLLMAYNAYNGNRSETKDKPFDRPMRRLLQMKPIRTSSGVAPVTVLTKPFPCPGKCVFCPSDVRMPKSYLSDEPGAQRAERNYFDPYLQTNNRLTALHAMGHQIDKVELIILGGTWSFYPESYQIWFIKECFRAINEFGENIMDSSTDIKSTADGIRKYYSDTHKRHIDNNSYAPSDSPDQNRKELAEHEIKGEDLKKRYNQIISEVYTAPERKLGLDEYQSSTWEELEKQQYINETSKLRNVGLVIETRPDNISPEEVIRIRRLGCTKTQIGVQSLQDSVLSKNNRGHDVAATRRAFALLRQAGFKIHAHWMANLYGSDVDLDKKDYEVLFNDLDFKPDELKLYPCSLIESAELMQIYKAGLWKPYNHEELLEVLSYCLTNTPQFCRLTRVIRDIPSQDIVSGNKKSNFRQIAEQSLAKLGRQSKDIRAREIRREEFDEDKVRLDVMEYETSTSKEFFLQFVAPVIGKPSDINEEKLLAFLRLSLPSDEIKKNNFMTELLDSAIIREIHVYGRATKIGSKTRNSTQHKGFGSKLIEKSKEISKDNGFDKLAVISAIGTKEYYKKRGFEDTGLYQVTRL